MKILKAKTVIVGDGDTVIKDGAVVIEKGLITRVGQQQEIETDSCDNIVDYGDSTILPGLIDMHVHIAYWQTKSDKDLYLNQPGLVSLLAANELQQALALGVTTIRNVGEPQGQAYALKMGYKKGFITGPRYITSASGISCTGGHGTQIPDMIMEVNGPYQFRAAVREQIKKGADWIKVLASHRTHMCEITQQELNAAADEAHRWLRKCCIHAGTTTAIDAAIEAGFDTIEHGTFMTVEQAQRAKEKGIAWIPTIIPYWNGYQMMKKMIDSGEIPVAHQAIIDENYAYFAECAARYQQYFKEIASTGIKIAVGTDIVWETLPITPVADEMKLMVDFGMGILQTIKCGTSAAAEVLGLGDTVGLLREGYLADILVVDNDAATNITALKNVREVYRDGEVVYSGVTS